MRNIISLTGLCLMASIAATPSLSQNCDATGTVGSGGSAAAGGTSASSLGTGGTCRTDSGTTSSVGSGGSAAAVDGQARSQTRVNENPNQLKSQTKAQAMDQGTFSKSQTKTTVRDNDLDSKTRTMWHLPGEKPVKSTTNSSVTLPQQ